MADLYLQNPPEDKTYRFVLQNHPRGLSAHLDFRYEFTPSKLLLGWTLDAVKSLGKIRPGNLVEAKKFSAKGIDDFVDICHDPTRKIVVQKKAPEPPEWRIVDDATFPPGTVGATASLFGYMYILDKGKIEYGSLKPHFTELYLWGTKKWKGKRIMWGRFVIRALPNVWRKKSLETGESEKTGKGYLVHMAWFPGEEPYCLSSRAVKKEWMPPIGISALPKYIRKQVPEEFQYWKKKTKEAARKMRDDLFAAMKKKDVKISYEIKSD